MGAGWLYYHKYPPKRKCSVCGKRHYMKRVGVMSNGEDVWRMFCTQKQRPAAGLATPYWEDK